MTLKDYISQRFGGFGVEISEADLLDISLASSIGEDDEVDEASYRHVNIAVAKFIPSLLLRATSVNESGFSMSWDTQGIRDYYALLCKEYGLEDKLNNKPKVTFY
jgi:hypothetical protein